MGRMVFLLLQHTVPEYISVGRIVRQAWEQDDASEIITMEAMGISLE